MAVKLVVVFGNTLTARPGEANAAAVPMAACEPEQSAVVYRRTVEPGSAEPVTEPLAGEPRLGERLGREVVCSLGPSCPAQVVAVHPLGVPLVEVPERRGVRAGGGEEIFSLERPRVI